MKTPALNHLLRCLASLAIGSVVSAAPGPKPAGEVVLGGPLVVKLDWNTRSLQGADINGDGLNRAQVGEQQPLGTGFGRRTFSQDQRDHGRYGF